MASVLSGDSALFLCPATTVFGWRASSLRNDASHALRVLGVDSASQTWASWNTMSPATSAPADGTQTYPLVGPFASPCRSGTTSTDSPSTVNFVPGSRSGAGTSDGTSSL